MNHPEVRPTPETHEDPEFKAFKDALEHEEALLTAMDHVLKTTPDRLAAERRIAEEYAPQIEAALRTSRGSLDRWLTSIHERSA